MFENRAISIERLAMEVTRRDFLAGETFADGAP